MKANKLRIGNWLNGPEGNAQVTGIQNREVVEIGEMGHVMEDVSPIPLTEDWLIKFGFVREGMLTMRLGEFTCYCEEDYIDNFCLGDIELFDVIPKYVHQLQNLYFALTGEELTIKQ